MVWSKLAALALLAPHTEDPPSRVLAERCRHLQRQPPSDAWDGTYVAVSK